MWEEAPAKWWVSLHHCIEEVGRELDWSGRGHLVGTRLCCQLSLCHVMSHVTGRLWDTDDLKTLHACQLSWVMGPSHCLPLGGGMLGVKFFLCGRRVHQQISIRNKLTKCLHNLEKGRGSTLPMPGFFLHARKWRLKGSHWLPRLPGQAAGSWLSEEGSRWPRGSMGSQPRFPWRILEGCTSYFGSTKLLGPNQVQPDYRCFKPTVWMGFTYQKANISHVQEESTLSPNR